MFIKLNKISILAICLILFSSIIVGCIDEDVQESVVTSTSSEITTAEKQTLIVGEMFSIRSLDPAKCGSGEMEEKARIVETLVEANPDSTLIPSLAKSWEQINDLQWRFNLRENVKFHDGTELTADSVKWSIERAVKVNPSLKSIMNLKSIEAVDKRSLIFTTEQPFAAFPATLVFSPLGILSPTSKTDEKENIVTPIGTGPFKFEKIDTATGTLYLDRNNEYWETKSQIENIIIKPVPDPASRAMSIEKGEIDITCDIPYGDIERLKATSGLNVETHLSSRVYNLKFSNLNETPYSDVRVRKAISYAIDRKVICERTLHGCASPAIGPVMPTVVWANDNLKGYSYEPEKAKQLLAEAGWKDADGDGILEKDDEKFSIRLYTHPQRPGQPPMAEAIQAMLKDVGIKVDVRVMDYSAIKEQITDRDMQLSAYSLLMVPDPDYYLRRTFHSEGAYNTFGYSNSEMDSLLEEGLRVFDEDKRQEIYNRVQEIALDEVPLVTVAYYNYPIVMREYVKGYIYNPVCHDYILNNEMYIEVENQVSVTASQTPGEQTSAKETEKTLVVGEMWDIRTVDPVKSGEMVKEKAMIVDTLVEANPDFTLRPGLSESWEQVSDLQWKFYLKKDVKFHDGTEFTADVVKWSIERAMEMNPPVKAVTQIKSIKIVDKHTLLFTTEKPYAAFPASLEYPGLGILSPTSKTDDNGIVTKPIGTGPFKFERFDVASGTLYLLRNNDYWGIKPGLEKVVIKGIPDPASRAMSVEKGEIGFTCDVPYGDIERLKTTPGLKVDTYPTARVYQIQFGNITGTLYSDVRVRKAISYAIDREVISVRTLHGCASPAIGPVMPMISWSNQELEGYPYNSLKAKQLLKEAGWEDTDENGIVDKNGEEFGITLYTYPQRPGLKPMAEAIQSMLKDVGIKVEVRVMDWSAIGEHMTDRDLKLSGTAVAMVPDPDYYLRKTYHSNGNSNVWNYNNPEMDSLLEEGLSTFHTGKRQEIYDRVQEIALDEVPIIHVAYYKVAVVMHDNVKGFVFNPIAHDYMLNPEMYIAS